MMPLGSNEIPSRQFHRGTTKLRAIFPMAQRANEGEEVTESAEEKVYSFMMILADQTH